MLLGGVTRSLKRHGGLPQLPELLTIYESYLSGHLLAMDAISCSRDVQAAGGHNKHVSLAVRVLHQLIVQNEVRPEIVDQPGQRLAEAFLQELMNQNVLDPSIPEVENLGRFTTLKERDERSVACRCAVDADGRLPRIADILLKDPTASKMRLPASRQRRVSTADMLTYTVG